MAMIQRARRFLRVLFRSSLSWGVRLWLVARNNVFKLVHWKECCGHPGQPGC